MKQNSDGQFNIEDVGQINESPEQNVPEQFTEEEQSASPVDIQRQQAQALRWKTADKVFNILLWIAIVLLVSLVAVRAFVATNIGVDGESMMPTYRDKETLWLNKLAKPKRGQVAVFYKFDVDSKFLALFGTSSDNSPNGKYGKLIKRVVAVEGDEIWVEPIGGDNYKLFVQTPEGQVLQEDYYQKDGESLPSFVIPESRLGRLADFTKDNPHVIAAGYFFAMGDNRPNSSDSRGELGDVPFERVFGVVLNT